MEKTEIIKALECCGNFDMTSCDRCPYTPQEGIPKGSCECSNKMMLEASVFIKEQQADNEKLTINMNAYGLTVKNLAEEIDKLKAQNETLEIYNKDYKYRNKELQKANEGLAKNCEELEIVGDELREHIANLKNENKYLRERLAEEAEIKEDMRKAYGEYEETTGLKQIRADTVKKMQEKLKSTFCPDADYYGTDVQSAIDQIAKEILEEQ